MPLKATERDVYEFFSKAGKVSGFFYFILFSILSLKYFNISYFLLPVEDSLYLMCETGSSILSFLFTCINRYVDLYFFFLLSESKFKLCVLLIGNNCNLQMILDHYG